MNDVKLSGRLTADPKGTTTPNGKTIANFSLAIDRFYKDANGETQKEVQFFQVACYNGVANYILNYIHKGDKIFVNGFLKQSKWVDGNGNKRESVGIVAQSVESMVTRRADVAENNTETTPVAPTTEATTPVEAKPEQTAAPEATNDTPKMNPEDVIAKAQANGIPAEVQSEFDVFGSEIDDSVFGF